MFLNRIDAWEKLKTFIENYIQEKWIKKDDVVVVFLPRGGLPVAYPLLKENNFEYLNLPIKKIPSPFNEEVAIGAISPDGDYFLDKNYVNYLWLDEETIKLQARKAMWKIQRMIEKYNINLNKDLKDKVVFIIDDGIATGSTALLAAKYIKSKWAAKVILAVPVCPLYLSKSLVDYFDDIICLLPIRDFQAVGQGYVDFSQVSDEEFIKFLNLLKRW
jgi:putative phosphoribosyl transferase